MNKLTPQEMARRAVLARARAEATIIRSYILNEVLPEVEAEFDRRLAAGESLSLSIPSGEALGTAFAADFRAQNAKELE
jgi:hypothetical protein